MFYKDKICNNIYLSNLDLTKVSHALGVHVHKEGFNRNLAKNEQMFM